MHNKKINLQVPMSTTLKLQAEEMAGEQGFSSLQELIRVFISNYTNGKISVSFNTPIDPQTLEVYEKELEKMNSTADTST